MFDQKNIGRPVAVPQAVANHRLAWGAEYEHTDNERTRYKGPTTPGDFVGYNELSFPATTSERSALWAFDEIKFGERWVLTPGARYDYYRMTPDNDPAYTGDKLHKLSEGEAVTQAGSGVKAHEAANLFAQYSHGFKTPCMTAPSPP